MVNDRRIVDTNLIVRHLLHDDPKHTAMADSFFAAAERKQITAVVMSTVLAESVFVLSSFYGQSRDDVADALAELITSPGVTTDNTAVCLDALRRFRQTKAHFVDCMVAASAVAANCAVASFDRDFRQFKDVTVDVKPH